MIVDLGVAVLVVTVGLLEWLLEHRWHDRRVRIHRVARHTQLVLFLLLGAFSISNVYQSRQESTRLSGQITGLEAELAKARKEATDNAKAASDEAASMQSRLDQFEQHLKQFVEIARRRFPGLPDEQALKELASEVEKVRELAAIDVPRAMTPGLRQHMTSALGSVRARFPGLNPGFKISTSSGSRNQQIASVELAKLFKEAGFWFAGGGEVNRSPPPLEPLYVNFRPAEQKYGDAVAQELTTIFGVPVLRFADPSLQPGVVRVVIQGEPIFTKEGLTTFR